MSQTPFWDRVFKTTSWFIVAALVFATVMLYTDPPNGKGPITVLLGTLGAQIFYSTLYLGEAVSLAYAKVKKRSLWRKNTLLAIYLTGAFTTLLTINLNGWTSGLLDNLVITITAAGCWLYWIFKTEYLSDEEWKRFNED